MKSYVSHLTKRAMYGEQTVFERDTRACDRCRHFSPQVRQTKRPNHLLHLLGTIFLLGLWLPVWAFLTFRPSRGEWTCQVCGATKR